MIGINVLVAQIFASLLSGRSYGHYFIQILPGVTYFLAVMLNRLRYGLSWCHMRLGGLMMVLMVPMIIAGQSAGRISVYARPEIYYPAFYGGYLFGDEDAKSDFVWRGGEVVKKTVDLSEYINKQYRGDENIYVYTRKPWILALLEGKTSNKFVTWYHLSYRDEHMREGLDLIRGSDLIVVDRDTRLLGPVEDVLSESFELIDKFEGFDVYGRVD
jgi:hypothetical protein